MRELILTFLGLLFFGAINAQVLPREIPKCNFGDSQCIVRSMNALIRKFPRGIPALGLKPIDVVDIEDSKFWDDERVGAFWINTFLYNQVNCGFENTTITKVNGFDENPTSSLIEIHGRIPSLVHKGRYFSEARITLIKLNSSGESLSDFQNFRFVLKLKVIMEYRNNKRFLKIYELTPFVNMDRWVFWLDNFFADNTDATIAINQVFNKYWVELWNELEPKNLKIFSSVFRSIFEDVFAKISYDDMFLPVYKDLEVNN